MTDSKGSKKCVYIRHDMAVAADEYCKERKLSLSSLIDRALRLYFRAVRSADVQKQSD